MTIRIARQPLALIMEWLWSFAAVAIVVRVVGGGAGPAPSIFAVAAIVFGSFAVARVLRETAWGDRTFRIAGVLTSFVALFVIMQLDYAPSSPWEIGWVRTMFTAPSDLTSQHANVIVAAVALAVLWMRGIARGLRTLDFDDVLGGAALGIVAVGVAAAASPPVHGPDLFGVIAIAYVVIGLCVLALYQAAEPDRPLVRFASQWSAGLAVLVGVAFVLAIVAAAIDPRALGVAAPIGRPLADGVGLIFRYVLGPPIAGIAWLLEWIIPHGQQAQQQTPQLGSKPDIQPTHHGRSMWVTIAGWIGIGAAVALVLGVAALILWSLFRRFRRPKTGATERRERIEAEVSLGDDLGAMLNSLLGRFRRAPARTSSAIAIRRLYEDMLDRAAIDGAARPASATPLEFAPRLDVLYGSDAPSAISAAFAASRYGDRDVDLAAVRDLEARWAASRRGPASGNAPA